MLSCELARQLGHLSPIARERGNGRVTDDNETLVFQSTPLNSHPFESPKDDHFYVELQRRDGSSQRFKLTVKEV